MRKSHESCKSARAGSWYPTRLIDCGPLDSPQRYRLVETKSTPTTEPYVSLRILTFIWIGVIYAFIVPQKALKVSHHGPFFGLTL